MPVELEPIPGGEATATDPLGYTSVADVRTFMGLTAADYASNTNGNPTGDPEPNYAAYEQAMAWAGSEVTGPFTASGYGVPLAFTAGSVAAKKLNLWATTLAAWWLSKKRPGNKETVNSYDAVRESVMAEIPLYASGLRGMPGLTVRDGSSPAITVVDARSARISAGANMVPVGAGRDSGMRFIQGYGWVQQG